MKKKTFICLTLLINCVIFCFIACSRDMKIEENKYVSAEEFMNYYGLTEEEVPVKYVEWHLQMLPLEQFQLSEYNYANSILDLYEDTKYSLDRYDYYERDYEYNQEKFQNCRFMFVEYSEPWVDGVSAHVITIDMENNILYYNGISVDYTKAEITIELDEESIEQVLDDLFILVTPEWEEHDNDYSKLWWKVYLVEEENKVIYFEGYMNDEETTPGFTDWLQSLHELAE